MDLTLDLLDDAILGLGGEDVFLFNQRRELGEVDLLGMRTEDRELPLQG
jgi:hypothetical protein